MKRTLAILALVSACSDDGVAQQDDAGSDGAGTGGSGGASVSASASDGGSGGGIDAGGLTGEGTSAADSSGGGDTGEPPPSPDCGDAQCSALETCSSCAADCGACPTDCADAAVLCVDDSPGEHAEFDTIQAAADVAVAGDTVLVFAGNYAGVELTASGEPGQRIELRAAEDGVVVDAPAPGDGCADGPAGVCIVGSDELAGVHDVVVEGFRIVGMARSCVATHSANPGTAGVATPHQRLVLRALHCEGAGHEGLYLSEVGDSLLEDNDVVDAGSNGEDRGHGIYLANAGCDGTILRHNRIHWDAAPGPAEGAGIHFNGDLSVEGDGGGDGLITGIVVERNTIWGSSHNGLNMDGVQASRIADNLVYGNARNAIVVYAIDAAAGAAELAIVGNTFVVPPEGTGAAIRLEQDEGGHVIVDNILVNEGGGPSISLGSAPLQSDYNAVIDGFAIDDGDLDFAAWQAMGYDAHSILVDGGASLFVGDGDWHLLDGAPAIDAGVDMLGGVAASAIDLAGQPRPQGGGIDLGAYER